MPLGGAFTRYRSDEILAQLRMSVNNSFKIFFRRPRAKAISRRGIVFRGAKIIAKIFTLAAELLRKKIQF